MKLRPFQVAAFLLASAAASACGGSGALSVGGLYGPYPAVREASGTAWGPEASPADGVPFVVDGWTGMARGFASGVYDRQAGSRGGSRLFLGNEALVTARRPFGAGAWGVRAAASLEPLMGRRGYPLLLQTGGIVDGTPLLDRQPPRDLLMELAATFNMPLSERSSAFVYGGLPGEPALGPAPAPYRFSGQDNPEAPLTREWFEAARPAHGVITVGYAWGAVKLEGSAFNGREPDQNPWDLDPVSWNSHAARLTVNPSPAVSMQVSGARFHAPDPRRPDIDLRRITSSISVGRGPRELTAGWGRDKEVPGRAMDGWMLEGAERLSDLNTLFARLEAAEKCCLLPSDPGPARRWSVGKVAAGYVRDFFFLQNVRWGAGASAGVYILPPSLQAVYGKAPLSLMVFLRARLGLPQG